MGKYAFHGVVNIICEHVNCLPFPPLTWADPLMPADVPQCTEASCAINVASTFTKNWIKVPGNETLDKQNYIFSK